MIEMKYNLNDNQEHLVNDKNLITPNDSFSFD